MEANVSTTPITEELLEHADFDRSKVMNLVRLINLLSTSWTLQRGRGPREHQRCIWCHGDIPDDCEIIVHANGSCNNAWPASCFLQWLELEFQLNKGTSRYNGALTITCPMCRESMFSMYRLHYRDCEAAEGPSEAKKQPFAPYTAFIKIVPFSPDYVLQCAIHENKPIIFLEHSQVSARRLRFFANDMELLVAYAAIGRLPESGKPHMPSPPDKKNLYCEKSYGGWVLVDVGNNHFRMCTFIGKDVSALFKKLTQEGANVRSMTADTFNQEAQERGGLLTVLSDMGLIKDKGTLQQIRATGEEFMCGVHPQRTNEDQAAYFHLFAALTGARSFEDPSNGRLKSFLKQWHLDMKASAEAEALKDIMSKIEVPPGWKVLSSSTFLPPPGTSQQDIYKFLQMVTEKCPEKFVEVMGLQTPHFGYAMEHPPYGPDSPMDDGASDIDADAGLEATGVFSMISEGGELAEAVEEGLVEDTKDELAETHKAGLDKDIKEELAEAVEEGLEEDTKEELAEALEAELDKDIKEELSEALADAVNL